MQTPPHADDTVDFVSASRVNDWLAGFQNGTSNTGPSVEELQSSVSWRVTRPLRAAKLRERLQAFRTSGTIRLAPVEAAPTGIDIAREALHSRLAAIAAVVLAPGHEGDGSLEQTLAALTSTALEDESSAHLWLLMTAVSGCMPDDAFLLGLRRDLQGVAGSEASYKILQHSTVWAVRHGSHLRRIEVVSDRPVVYVNFTARHGYNSGVQRVTRGLVSEWDGAREFALAALTHDGTGLRELDERETDRVVRWNAASAAQAAVAVDESQLALVVPWNTVMFVPEIPDSAGSVTLRALARFSGNRTIAIGYDTIPVVSATYLDSSVRLDFSRYLSMLKYFDEVVAISQSAANEFEGFRAAVRTQGLKGASVCFVALPGEPIQASPRAPSVDRVAPMVLSVSNNEPRKNQMAVVFAAEMLWREGFEFSLVVAGGAGPVGFTHVSDAAAALRAKGRDIEILRDNSEDDLADAYSSARFSVFVSFHEGYGLPITESLAAGTPVITTCYGSAGEIAALGGCLTVDPRNDDEIVESMRRLLASDDELARLESDIASRAQSTAADYADSIWRILADKADDGVTAHA